MRRREFITLLGGAAAGWPRAARAQQAGRVPRVAFWLGGAASTDSSGQRNAAALRDALRTLGWIEGRNVQIELRWGDTSFTQEDTRKAAAEIIALAPDVIVTTGAPILAALHRQTKTI